MSRLATPLGRAVAALAILLPATSGPAFGQHHDARAPRPVIVRFGATRNAPVCLCRDDQAVPHDRDLFTASIGTEWLLRGANKPLQLSWAVDVLPMIISRNTADADLAVWSCGNMYCGHSSTTYPWNTTAVGAGVMPIGLVTRMRVAPALSMRARLSGGMVYMSRPVPVMQSRNLNFIAELALGAELHVRNGLMISAGATQNHISNGNTAPVNLGMDTRLLELGIAFAR